jgi:PAS domain S-box-containing protein
MIAAVYFISHDGAHLEKAAAPSVPDGFIRIIEQVQLAPDLGTCSSAVFRKTMVVTEDVETDKLWEGVRDVAREYGVRACWAQPIFSRSGEVTGIFSMYFREPRRPDSFDIQLARDSAAAISLVAEHVGLRDSLAATNKRLKESEERFRALADSAFDSVVIHDKGRIVVANISAAQLLGYERDELEGESLSRFIDPEFHGILAEKIQGPAKSPYEIRCVRKDGSRFWGEVRSRDVVYEGKSMRVASLRDVTERRSWEEQKELAIQQERQARLEAERAIQLRDDFLAIASHELKTPLTPLKLDLQIQRRFLSEAGLPPSRKKDLLLQAINHADREYERLVNLIDDLLDTSRISAGALPLKISEVDLSELVRRVAGRFAGEFHRAQCPLELDVEDGIVCACDGPRIQQVLSNLLQNAVKYGAGSAVEIRLNRMGEDAVTSVTDHGIGIAQENHATLFDRFVRAVPIESYGGLGLGLFIAKEIVDGHGGNIFVESSLGEGARFTVHLPLRHGQGNSVVAGAGKG